EEIKEVTEEQILKGQVLLDKRIKFVIRHTVEEELDGPVVEPTQGFVFVAHAALLPGPRRPAALADCEVILMVGMPGAGKTYWVTAHAAANPQKRYNVLSTGALFERMQVDCKPFRASYEGRWDAMVSKCAKCVLKLLEIAKGRRRNYILDQTNVYPSAQRRKLREFDGRRRVAVVVVPDEASHAARRARKDQADGKEVPDGAVLDMKANFALPEVSSWLDEVIYPELGPEEAKAVVEALHKEARAAGVHREREKRDRSPGRDQPPNKRSRDDRRHRDDRRPPRDHSSRDREDRWGGGGGGGGRWGPAGGGGRGGRWGSRDRSGPPAPGPPAPAPARFDRGWGAPARGNDFSRDRDDFRGGRGGPGGPGGRGGPGNRGGPRGDRGPGGPPGGDRFGRPDRNQGRPGGPGMDKRPNAPGGGGGGWQRGNQGPGRGPPRPNQQMALRPNQPNQKDGQGQGQNPNQQNPQWNQWQNQWGNWNNWNQNQAGAWNWGNWGGWNQNANAANNTGGAAAAGGKQAQWAGYTPQQWYQWQQWQQQQGWQGYQQQQQGNQPTTANAAEQAWAQYYQNYGGGNANAANSSSDKK
ncbi:heterogeneous nuclear ribonucleoprotein U-like protein 1, partial [Ostrinia furnacalis]|uniref:heterogeneous nuclear ribonucleoprotein U-like protein 1 n=1 Tax=Ostrinia furnacalis TaxID=93504 RepID=UPI00103E9358